MIALMSEVASFMAVEILRIYFLQIYTLKMLILQAKQGRVMNVSSSDDFVVFLKKSPEIQLITNQLV